mmetsp:Transcript_30988/g.100114  ORF Transcript_30988/g.100114 Transcript_30988/m.100114 type:complete len:281 (-) Transcript_30988:120-962(-)
MRALGARRGVLWAATLAGGDGAGGGSRCSCGCPNGARGQVGRGDQAGGNGGSGGRGGGGRGGGGGAVVGIKCESRRVQLGFPRQLPAVPCGPLPRGLLLGGGGGTRPRRPREGRSCGWRWCNWRPRSNRSETEHGGWRASFDLSAGFPPGRVCGPCAGRMQRLHPAHRHDPRPGMPGRVARAWNRQVARARNRPVDCARNRRVARAKRAWISRCTRHRSWSHFRLAPFFPRRPAARLCMGALRVASGVPPLAGGARGQADRGRVRAVCSRPIYGPRGLAG